MANRSNGRAQQYSPPTLRDNNVARLQCIERAKSARPGSIVLIVAGAGCGKSTLLRQLYDTLEKKRDFDRVWIALEERDENVEEFWNLISNGFSMLDPAITAGALEQISNRGFSNIERLAALLAEAIDLRPRRIALFLDDFQFAAVSDSAKIIYELIRRHPKNLSIFMASRVAPKLPLESLKVDNRLIDLSWRELAFSEDETAEFFQVDATDSAACLRIEAFHRGTEGWAAGLQLALMKTRLSDAKPGEISTSAYSGDVARYFRSEIFDALPAEVRNFLVNTSALDRFNDELAAAVAGISAREARRIFDYLRDHGFFLIGLEGEGKWLRYHHLIQEYLFDIREERKDDEAASPEQIASRWFEERHLIPDAIEYAIRASDFDRASDLVEAYAIELFNKGAATELASWIGRIPNKIIVKRPQLPLYLCKIYAHMRQPIEGLRLQYDRCKQIIATLDAVGHFNSEQELRTLLTELDVSEAIIRFRAGDMTGVIEAGDVILERKQPIRTTFLASLHNIVGYAHFILGDNAKARASLTIARDLHLSARSVFGVVFAEAFKGMVSLADGTTTAAQRHFSAALDHAVSDLGAASLPASIARLYLNVLRYELNDPIDENEFERTLADCRLCCEPEIYATALLTRYHLLNRKASPEAAREALNDAIAYARDIGNDLIHLQVLYSALVHELHRGSMSAAVEIYDDAQALWSDAPDKSANNWDRRAFWRELYCAEMLLATAQPRKAAEIYQNLAGISLRHNRVRRHVQILAKRAAALAGAGQTEQAADEMLKALQIARPSRFVRTLLDSGPRVVDLISLCAGKTNDIELKLFIEKLLRAASYPNDALNEGADKKIVLDELTAKEIDVLRILTTGAKNREICEKLQISENTVKWHMGRIFQKLGAANRTEAAMIAKSVFASL
ncbi:MAG: LuxR C-terminal-related transcriptional regulator [Parvularculaceae bacterium]